MIIATMAAGVTYGAMNVRDEIAMAKENEKIVNDTRRCLNFVEFYEERPKKQVRKELVRCVILAANDNPVNAYIHELTK